MSTSEKDGHFMEKVITLSLPGFRFYCHIGLWYYLGGEELPSLTFIGSSNFG